METQGSVEFRNSPLCKHPQGQQWQTQHCSGNVGSRREKPISRNCHLVREDRANGEYAKESEHLNYWGRVRKAAVKTKPTITAHTQKPVRGVSDSSCEMGKRFVGSVGDTGNTRQLFDEMRERRKTVKNLKPTEPFNYHDNDENEHYGEMGKHNVGHRAKNGHTPKGINKRDDRNKLLNSFRVMCKSLKEEEEGGAMPFKKRMDTEAYNVLRGSGKLLKFPRLIGPIPGIKTGDEFEYRMELKIVGLHCPSIRGIDYTTRPNGQILATSIVSTEGYLDITVKPDMLIYTGEGGLFEGKGKKGSKDQELKGGNLALKNSIKEGNFIRVVRGVKPLSGYVSFKGGIRKTIFVYDGLYKVVDCYQVMGPYGNKIYQFKLERCPGQTSIKWEKYK